MVAVGDIASSPLRIHTQPDGPVIAAVSPVLNQPDDGLIVRETQPAVGTSRAVSRPLPADSIVAAGRTRAYQGAVWHLVRIGSVEGWANSEQVGVLASADSSQTGTLSAATDTLRLLPVSSDPEAPDSRTEPGEPSEPGEPGDNDSDSEEDEEDEEEKPAAGHTGRPGLAATLPDAEQQILRLVKAEYPQTEVAVVGGTAPDAAGRSRFTVDILPTAEIRYTGAPRGLRAAFDLVLAGEPGSDGPYHTILRSAHDICDPSRGTDIAGQCR